jgi:hypothetical protein
MMTSPHWTVPSGQQGVSDWAAFIDYQVQQGVANRIMILYHRFHSIKSGLEVSPERCRIPLHKGVMTRLMVESDVDDERRRPRRSVIKLRLGVAGALTLLLSVSFPAALANAYTAVAYAKATTMLDNEQPDMVRAVLPLTNMDTGEVHNLRSEIVAGNSRSDKGNGPQPARVALSAKMTCGPSGGTTRTKIQNTQNLLANAADVKIILRVLFTAPTAGDYECQLRVNVLSGLSLGTEQADLRSTSFIGDINGAIGPAGTAQIISHDPDEYNNNSYLALGAPGRQLSKLTDYTPAVGATSFDAVADYEVTSCYGNTANSCPQQSYPASGTARVYHRIVATPSSTASGCVAQASTATTVGVSNNLHHYRINEKMTVTLPASGCGTWTINIFVRDDGGTLPFVVNMYSPYTVTYARPTV